MMMNCMDFGRSSSTSSSTVKRKMMTMDDSDITWGAVAPTSARRHGSLCSMTPLGEPNPRRLMVDDDEMQSADVQNRRRSVLLSDADDADSDVHLSLCWSAGKLGAAYYDAGVCQIHVLNDVIDLAPDFGILRKVIRLSKPVVIVANIKQDDRWTSVLKGIVNDVSNSGSSVSPTIEDEEDAASDDDQSSCTQGINDESPSKDGHRHPNLHLVPSVDFDLGAARARIVSLNVATMPRMLSDSDRGIFMSSLVNFDNICQVRALGALLKYLDRKRINVELEDYKVKPPVMSITTFSVKDQVSIDDDTYRALQIFQKEWHPSVYKMASGMKEGLSLFGIINQCKSSIGSREMQTWFLRPSRDPDLLRSRQMAVAFGSDASNGDVVSTLQSSLRHIRNVSKILASMSIGQSVATDWQTIYKTVYHAIRIRETCKSLPQTISIFQKIVNSYSQDLLEIGSLISRIVDFEESVSQNRFVVKFGVDEELDQKKRNYNGLSDFMTEVARQELLQLDDDVEECKVIYLPQLGYLLALPMSTTMSETKDYTRPGLEFVFVSNVVVYYKSIKTKELDHLLGDTQSEILDHETQIMVQLQNVILEKSAVLTDVAKYAAQLDWYLEKLEPNHKSVELFGPVLCCSLLAMAMAAKEFNYVQPRMTEEDIIFVEQGRHPLQELCVSAFVANTTSSSHSTGKVKVLTGPNASGKSVYLKQVALIIFMAHIGSFVPAQKATIGYVDAIYTRVHTLESVSIGLSTFMIDLKQMSGAIRSATKRSLVIVDEFGKGTSAVDGMALLASCLEHWVSNVHLCPHLFVSTHIYSVLKLVDYKPGISFQMMEVGTDKGEVVYLYQLKDGKASCSYAHWVALQAGLPKTIVDRGLQITTSVCQSMPIAAGDCENASNTFARYSEIVVDFLAVELESDVMVQAFLKRVQATDVDVSKTRSSATDMLV